MVQDLFIIVYAVNVIAFYKQDLLLFFQVAFMDISN